MMMRSKALPAWPTIFMTSASPAGSTPPSPLSLKSSATTRLRTMIGMTTHSVFPRRPRSAIKTASIPSRAGTRAAVVFSLYADAMRLGMSSGTAIRATVSRGEPAPNESRPSTVSPFTTKIAEKSKYWRVNSKRTSRIASLSVASSSSVRATSAVTGPRRDVARAGGGTISRTSVRDVPPFECTGRTGSDGNAGAGGGGIALGGFGGAFTSRDVAPCSGGYELNPSLSPRSRARRRSCLRSSGTP